MSRAVAALHRQTKRITAKQNKTDVFSISSHSRGGIAASPNQFAPARIVRLSYILVSFLATHRIT